MALIDIVKFNGLSSREWIVYKHFAEDLSTATQLIVGEGQVAAFVKGGQLCDIFGPGTYTLSTNNIPILSKLINLPFGNKTPFTAEIYYINSLMRMDINWGTSDPIQLIDPKFNVRLRIRAFGQIGLKIKDYQFFIKELIGSLGGSEMINYDSVLAHFKGFLITKVKSQIAQIIINEGISALDISARLNDISDKLRELLNPNFEEFGLTLINFYVKSINFPEEDFEIINSILEKKAEFDIIGDARYATMRSYDVYEGAATNQNGVSSAFVGAGLGMGMGASLGTNIVPPATRQSTSATCPKCNAPVTENSKFCASCGSSLIPATTKCPKCSAELAADSKFCNICGAKINSEIICECGNTLKAGSAFCNECGKAVNLS